MEPTDGAHLVCDPEISKVLVPESDESDASIGKNLPVL